VGSYDDPNLRGQGDSTASQTAWAIMGLLAVGDTRSECVANGIAYLLRTQKKDGSWDEAFFTGTGFPRVFYLKYHLYRQYFPLIALTAYAKVMAEKRAISSSCQSAVSKAFGTVHIAYASSCSSRWELIMTELFLGTG
jgi:squalene-hopene/tetraprenyl-beta-curcumene cyclase